MFGFCRKNYVPSRSYFGAYRWDWGWLDPSELEVGQGQCLLWLQAAEHRGFLGYSYRSCNTINQSSVINPGGDKTSGLCMSLDLFIGHLGCFGLKQLFGQHVDPLPGNKMCKTLRPLEQILSPRKSKKVNKIK